MSVDKIVDITLKRIDVLLKIKYSEIDGIEKIRNDIQTLINDPIIKNEIKRIESEQLKNQQENLSEAINNNLKDSEAESIKKFYYELMKDKNSPFSQNFIPPNLPLEKESEPIIKEMVKGEQKAEIDSKETNSNELLKTLELKRNELLKLKKDKETEINIKNLNQQDEELQRKEIEKRLAQEELLQLIKNDRALIMELINQKEQLMKNIEEKESLINQKKSIDNDELITSLRKQINFDDKQINKYQESEIKEELLNEKIEKDNINNINQNDRELLDDNKAAGSNLSKKEKYELFLKEFKIEIKFIPVDVLKNILNKTVTEVFFNQLIAKYPILKNAKFDKMKILKTRADGSKKIYRFLFTKEERKIIKSIIKK